MKYGYISNLSQFEKEILNLQNCQDENIEHVEIKSNPTYTLKFISKEINTNEEEILEKIASSTEITYKFFAITLDGEIKEYVKTLEEAEKIVQEINDEYLEDERLNLKIGINEVYTKNQEETNIITVAQIKSEIEEILENRIKEIEEEEERQSRTVNGIEIAVLPITGTITSRFGAKSSIRSGDHTGLDIAAKTGTDIKVVADGTVTKATKSGAYGNLVVINHGNGIETYYAHTSKMYVNVGDTVKAGDVIAAVGSTGNSTGPHLHFEIRINGDPVNPQNYIYNQSN